MGETGKRTRNHQDSENEKRSHNKRSNQNSRERGAGGGSSDGGELVVYRILCPNAMMGSVIGKGGKVINSLRQETQAKIRVVDPFPGADHRVITIYCYVKEKVDVPESDRYDDIEPLCPAQDALIRVHGAIANAVTSFGDGEKKDKEEARLLIPASQAASVIGKAGVTIKKLRSNTGTNIKVNQKDPNDPTHSCAMSFDNFISITGDAEAVKKALYAISSIMYKFSPKEAISLDTAVSEPQGSIIVPSDVPVFPVGGFYTSDAIASSTRHLPSVVGSLSHVSELQGYPEAANAWAYPSTLPAVSEYADRAQSELVIRVLCPSDKIGRVIGKAGSSIKNVRKASGARVDVDDKKIDGEECVITITSTEYSDEGKSVALDALLLLQGRINDEDDEKVNIRLLVPSKVVGCLIGKGGSIINDMRKNTKADIRISKGDKPKCASDSEELVEVFGEVSILRNALIQIVARLRDDVLRERDGSQKIAPSEPMYSSSLSVPPVLSSIPPITSIGYDQRGETVSSFGMLGGGSLYGYNTLQGGDAGYGSFSSYSAKPYARLPPHEMVIPASAVGKVLGKGGSNLTNIQKISGAIVDIVESKSSRSERIAQISGTEQQMHMAENLIQAFIMAT